MKEQSKRLPIDPESVSYLKDHEMVYALGRGEYANMIFGFMENCGHDLQTALDKASSMSGGVDVFVIGVGINEEESDELQRVVFNDTSLGIWGNTIQDPSLKVWLENKKQELYV